MCCVYCLAQQKYSWAVEVLKGKHCGVLCKLLYLKYEKNCNNNSHQSYVLCTMYIRYLFQQILKFLEYSMDVFYGIRTLKSIDYSKNN